MGDPGSEHSVSQPGPEHRKIGGRVIRRSWWAIGPPILIGLSFAMAVAGNRWGTYLRSPVPGLFLADLLLAAGAGLGLTFNARSARPARWVVTVYGIVLVYVAYLALELLWVPAEDRYFAVRDASSFLYLALVPVLAVSLRAVSARSAIRTVRVATVLGALGPLLTHIGVLQPMPSSLLGSEYAEIFGYRADLTGAALALGVVAWSSWPTHHLRGWLVVQLALITVAGIAVTSRSGLVAVAVSIAVVAYRQSHWPARIIVGLTLIAGLTTGALASNALLAVPPTPAPAITPTPIGEPAPTSAAIGGLALPAYVERTGTVAARLDTWIDIVSGMTRDRTWLVGGRAGSDYLYELCTGVPVAPPAVELPLPKCDVDDYGPNPTLRDPHNWILNLAVTHGLLGVVIFILALAIPMWRGRKSEGYGLAVWTVGFYLITGLTFIVSAGYAMIPIAVGTAWIVSRSGFRQTGSGAFRPEPVSA